MGRRRFNESERRLSMTRRRFERWRRTRKGGERIPEDLWAEAVELAGVLGINPVVRTLGVNYGSLKERLPSMKGRIGEKQDAGFVELDLPALSGGNKVVIKVSNKVGEKMRIDVPEATKLDVTELMKWFWSGPS